MIRPVEIRKTKPVRAKQSTIKLRVGRLIIFSIEISLCNFALGDILGSCDPTSNSFTTKNAGDGSGNLFIVEQGGRVRIFDGVQSLPGAFLDINTFVSNENEQACWILRFTCFQL